MSSFFNKLQPNIKFILAGIFVCMSVFFNFLNVLDANQQTRLKWDGVKYDSVIKEYINGGYRLDAIKGDNIEASASKEEYTSRVAYIWLNAQIYRITNADLVDIYLAVSLVFFMATALVLMKIGVEFYGFGLIETLFCGLFFSAMPSLRIVFEVGAHPDAEFYFFACLSMYFFYKNKHIPAALCALISILFKRGGLIVPIYIISFMVAQVQQKRINYLHLAYYVVATVYGYFLPRFLIPDVGLNAHHGQIIELILANNKAAMFPYFLNNFQYLTFPFLLFALNKPFGEKMALAMVILAGLLMHVYNVVDWWRVWFGLLFIWGVPYAVAYFKQYTKLIGINGITIIFSFMLFGLYQTSATVNMDAMRNFPVTIYLIFFVVLIALEVTKRLNVNNKYLSNPE